MSDTIIRAVRACHMSRVDAIGIIAAIISLLTFTVLLPAGLHIPW